MISLHLVGNVIDNQIRDNQNLQYLTVTGEKMNALGQDALDKISKLQTQVISLDGSLTKLISSDRLNNNNIEKLLSTVETLHTNVDELQKLGDISETQLLSCMNQVREIHIGVINLQACTQMQQAQLSEQISVITEIVTHLQI